VLLPQATSVMARPTEMVNALKFIFIGGLRVTNSTYNVFLVWFERPAKEKKLRVKEPKIFQAYYRLEWESQIWGWYQKYESKETDCCG
jgi:hypothetical protein